MSDAELPKLLGLLGLARVIVIDDDFTPPAAVMEAFPPKHAPAVDGLPPLPSGGDFDEHVVEHWDQVPIAEKIRVKKLALKIKDFTYPDDDPTGLRTLVGDLPFIGMTLFEWQAQEARILASPSRALILFDVDFTRETGSSGNEEGLDPAARALDAEHDHIVGLLTGKPEIGGEEAAAADWAGRARVARADLVVVNKQLLDASAAERVGEAVEQLRQTLQASQLRQLRETVRTSLSDGIAEAVKIVEERAPSVIEDLVFRKSREGGEWEGDTWFRLYGTLGFDKARRRVALDLQTRQAIRDVRNLLHWRPQPEDGSSAELAREVQNAECYDDADYLNGAGLPIANGDLFETKAGTAYILVGQPCDLMLRPDGRARNPQTATLLPIKPGSGNVAGASSAYRFPPGSPLGEGDWEVRFRPEHHVAFDVLDLVSFNTEGRAAFKAPKGTAVEPLLPGLQRRHDAIEATVEGLAPQLEQVTELLRSNHLNKLAASRLRHSILHSGGPFRATLNGAPTPFAFDCRRVGRLSGTYADALLAAHSAARARTAHAHDLTRIVSDGEA
jgi:hypothetical protein